MKKIALILLLSLAASCGRKAKELPKDVLPPATMVDIQVAVQLAESKISNRKVNKQQQRALFDAYVQKIYEEHNTDSLAYQKSFDFYMTDLELAKDIHQKVKDSLESMRENLMKAEPEKSKVPIDKK